MQPLHADIQSHQQPIVKCADDIEKILTDYSDRLPESDLRKLREGLADLTPRYDTLSTQSYDRLKKLSGGIDDIQKLEVDFSEFLEYLKSAEQSLDKVERNVGQDLRSLGNQRDDHTQFGDEVNDQKGDIKFLNKAAQTYLDMAKVGCGLIWGIGWGYSFLVTF